jgi:PAS domain S-box-containing protein
LKSIQDWQKFLGTPDGDVESLLKELVDNPAFGFHSIGPDGEFLHISDAELTWLGYERHEIMGKMRFQDLLTPQDRKRFEVRFPKFKKLGIAKDVEYTYVSRDGRPVPISINGTSVIDSSGKFIKTRTVIVDLTQRRQAETAARRLALQQQREDLAALLAHDLKVPLLGSNRLFDLLLADELGPTTAAQREIFETMRASNSLVLEKIKTILEIHRYESVEAPLLYRNVPLSIVLERCIADCSALPVCREKELTFECDLMSSSNISVDERAWELLLNNLLRNAINASPVHGKIRVRSKVRDKQFEVSIRDQGRGIDPAQQDKLFVRFWQGTSHQLSANTGMGLYLCGKIVSAYGGFIACESKPGQGANFTVTMPLTVSGPPESTH